MSATTLGQLYGEYFGEESSEFFIRGSYNGQQSDLNKSDFATLVGEYIGGLNRSELKRGDRVVLLLETSIDYVAVVWACILAGCTAVPLATPSRRAVVGEVFAQLDNILLIASPAMIVVEQPALLVPGDDRIVELGQLRCDYVEAPIDEVSPEDIAVLQFTSGSTGNPKGCALSHRAIAANVAAMRRRLPFSEGDALVSWLPLFHDMGLMSAVFLPIASRGCVSLRAPSTFIMNPMVWLQDLSQWPACHSPVPNFALSLTLQKVAIRGLNGIDLSGVKTIVCGAEPIDAELVRKFTTTLEECQLKPDAFQAAYGMAEGTLMATSKPGGLATITVSGREFVNVGKPIPGAALRIVDERDREVTAGCEGHIQIQSPSLMSAYYKDPKATEEKFSDQWLRTGDIGCIDEGDLFVFGRSDDLMIISGRNIYPADLEATIARAIEIPSSKVVAFAAAGGNPLPSLHILVELRANKELREAAKTKAVSACIRSCGVAPTSLEFVSSGSIPKTTSGKIKRSALRARATSIA